ncbi:MAG TPA: TIGR03435 family protein [Bryobacteraceae bacterium]|nr:TIGR03435 family protein [Bryobacteraceae bacterium]
MSVFGNTIVYLLVVFPIGAQSRTFAKIRVNPARSAGAPEERVRVLPNGDLIANGVPVIGLLSYAYDVPANPSQRLMGLPDWAVRERFDIEAKSLGRREVRQMFREVLAESFRLALRVQNKTMPVYSLAVAGGGPKLQESAITEKDCTFDTGPEGCHHFAGGRGHPLIANAIDMDDLVRYIENWTDFPVVNRTALRGLFTVKTEGWIPMTLPPPPPNATPNPNAFAGLPTIFAVLRKLGLELRRQEETLPVYTVERIERPVGN